MIFELNKRRDDVDGSTWRHRDRWAENTWPEIIERQKEEDRRKREAYAKEAFDKQQQQLKEYEKKLKEDLLNQQLFGIIQILQKHFTNDELLQINWNDPDLVAVLREFLIQKILQT